MWNYRYYTSTSPFKDYRIKTVTIGDGITSIGDYAFYSCRGLTELTLPNSVTSIGNPNSVTSIGNSAFGGCSGLEKITVDGGNKRYDSRDNCNSIIETGTNTLIVGCKNSVIPNSVTSIGDGAFRGCSGLTELTLPNSVWSIGEYAFQGCSGLTELTLPSSVKSIGGYAFSECSGLTKLTLPDSLESIERGAFQGCTGLAKLTLPDSLESIVSGAFRGCTGLSKITSLAEIPPVFVRRVFDGEEFGEVNKANCELIVPEGSITAYKQAKGWNEFSSIRGFAGEKK